MINYIELCGPIGAGKTTLATQLAVHGYLPLIENLGHNPYLGSFHQEPDNVGFETELSFLIQHYHLVKKGAAYGGRSICDFSFALDAAYSELFLPPKRQTLFAMLTEEMLDEIGLPRAIVYLACPPDILLSRIRSRSRPFEQQITCSQLTLIADTLERKLDEASAHVKVIKLDSSRIILDGPQCNLKEVVSAIDA